MLRSVVVLFVLLILGNNVFADQTKQFEFNGQPEVELKLLNELFEIKTRYDTVDDTCYNNVPYVVNVCRNVTRYNTQCHTQPAYEDCQNVVSQQCRDVTRTRRECRDGPVRQVCRPGPSQQVCSPGPLQQVCRNTPATQSCRAGPTQRVCKPGPTREECSTGASQRVCKPGPTQRVCEAGRSQQVCRPGPEREVCENVKKTECNVVNGRRICREVTVRECKKVPGKEICRTVPGQQVCRNVPGAEVCTNRPGRRTCRQVPGPQVCSNVPGQQICSTVPGRRVCENVRGPDVCRTVPGQDVCQNVAGPQICRDVAYNDRECHPVSRRVCQMVPPQQVCQQVPYDDRVCQDETQYRQEPYACTRQVAVNYREKVGEEVAELFFRFGDYTGTNKGTFSVTLKDGGEIQLAAQDSSEDSSLIILRGKDENRQQRDGRNLLIKGSYQIDFQTGNPLEPIQKGIKKLKLRGDRVKFLLPKTAAWKLEDLKFDVSLTRAKDRMNFSSPVSFDLLEFKQKKNATEVSIPLHKLGVDLKFLRFYKVSVTIRPNINGQVLNGDGPQGQISAQEVRLHL